MQCSWAGGGIPESEFRAKIINETEHTVNKIYYAGPGYVRWKTSQRIDTENDSQKPHPPNSIQRERRQSIEL